MNKIEVIFFSEMFFSCKAYCSGCNINKKEDDTISYTNEDLELINKKMISYTKKISKEDNIYYYPSITIGPADFISLPHEKIIEILDKFDNEIKLILAGNLSLKNETEKIKKLKEYQEKTNKNILIQLVFNPIMKNEHKKILKNNLDFILKEFKRFDTVLNMSDEIYSKLSPEKFLKTLLEFNIGYVTLVSSPTDFLITKKMFQTPLKKETEWLYELGKIWYEKEYYKNVEIAVYGNRIKFFNNYYFNNNNLEETHSYFFNVVKDHYKKILYIDNKMNLYLSCENIGDYHYFLESGFESLGNIKNGEIYDLTLKNPKFNKLLRKQIKTILTDNICKDCKYKLYCITTPVAWQKEKYKQYKGNETKEYCYGLKKINDYIYNNIGNKVIVKNYDY